MYPEQFENVKKTAGSIITFGRYKQGASGAIEPIEWIVLRETMCEISLLSRKVLDKVRYIDLSDEELQEELQKGNFEELSHTSWEESFASYFLNEEFLKIAFSKEEQERLLPINNTDLVSCLSRYELRDFEKILNDELDPMPTEYLKEMYSTIISKSTTCKWWARYDESCHGPFVFHGNGNMSTDCLYLNDTTFIRPIIKIKI